MQVLPFLADAFSAFAHLALVVFAFRVLRPSRGLVDVLGHLRSGGRDA